ncbi:Uu.00g008900.m01.CDS01 [Anthostomella pinea]|uniref:Uu.00g008900.m01.CDS01 n=1 Tax=Anthostomella pinea TaxID=933095 RepID=A0AAI8YQ07_9PEZI|nr:Uu.00g008900.m01.CDS01 [Anthostomella pinea]
MLFKALAISILAFAGQATAATWYFLRYYPASGQQFTSFSGDMAIPTLQQAGTYYLWPGLQPTDGSGVYQNVLDGRSGTWWIGSGWCCSNPSLPWGDGFNTYGGEVVTFSNTLGDSTWTSTLTRQATGDTLSNDFALADKSFNQALFAVELTGVSWDFGPLAFSNVVITSTGGTEASWCNTSPENYNSATVYSISGLSSSVSGNTVTCTIDSLVLESPA